MAFGKRESGNNCSTNSPLLLRAEEVLDEHRSSYQNVLVRASDGLLYSVKLLASLEGPNALSNQIIGTELGRYLGLPIPNWSILELSGSCFRQIVASCSHFGNGIRPRPGVYFASRALSFGIGAADYQILPQKWFHRISNRNDFLGMLVLDLWTNRTGQRKALFTRSRETGLLTAFFAHNWQMFGGCWGDELQKSGTALYQDLRIYSGLDLEQETNWWLNRVRSIDSRLPIRMGSFVPSEWRDSGHIEQISRQLRNRQQCLEQLVEQEMKLIIKFGSPSSKPAVAEPAM